MLIGTAQGLEIDCAKLSFVSSVRVYLGWWQFNCFVHMQELMKEAKDVTPKRIIATNRRY
jgi:hypothetical protein